MYYISKYLSPIGGITMAGSGQALAGLWLDGQKYFADALLFGKEEKELPVFAQTKKWLDIYFTGKAPDFTPPLSMEGISPFRRRVWEIMLTIPFGQTMTYGNIAKLTGYAGGIDKKIALLKNEGADVSAFTLPKNGAAR